MLDETHARDGPPLPDPLDTAVRRGVTALWQEMEEALAAREGEMERQLGEKTAEAEETVQIAYAARDASRSELEHMAKQLVDAERHLSNQAEELKTLNNAHHALETQLASETTRGKGLTEQLADRAAANEQLTNAVGDAEQRAQERSAELTAAQAAHHEDQAQRERKHTKALAELKHDHAQDVADWRQRCDSLDKKLTKREKERAEQLDRANRTQSELLDVGKQLRDVEAQRGLDLEQLSTARRDAERLRAERDATDRERRLIQEASEALVTEKETRILTLEQTVADLRRALDNASNE